MDRRGLALLRAIRESADGSPRRVSIAAPCDSINESSEQCCVPNFKSGTSGRQARRGGISRCLARNNLFCSTTDSLKDSAMPENYAYGIIRLTFAASAGLTWIDLRSFRILPGAFVPSK